MIDPTRITYTGLTEAYDLFNERLFDGKLPRCLITMQRKRGAYGYFSSKKFGTRDGSEITDEIALNPKHFRKRTDQETLSTLVHEMCHLQQAHFGKPGRSGYHNKEWAGVMKMVGLIPSDTGKPAGKQTGQRVSHYIEPDGRFEQVCSELIQSGFDLHYVEWSKDAESKKKAASKTKYTCPSCGLNAWGKPGILLICEECGQKLEPEQS